MMAPERSRPTRLKATSDIEQPPDTPRPVQLVGRTEPQPVAGGADDVCGAEAALWKKPERDGRDGRKSIRTFQRTKMQTRKLETLIHDVRNFAVAFG